MKIEILDTFETVIAKKRIKLELVKVWSDGHYKFHFELRHTINGKQTSTCFVGYDQDNIQAKFFHQRYTYKALNEAGL